MDRPLKIAIVGGGLSGLATGVHLQLLAESRSTPIQLTLFESSPRIGGVIHTERIIDPAGEVFIVDHGADMFATQPPAALDLCRALGVEDHLQRPQPEGRGAMIARGNRLIPIPEGFVLMRPTKLLSMLTTPLLSPAGKLRLIAERFIRPRDPALTDESVGSFVTRRLGSECLNNIVAPLVAGIYTADVHRLSMAATMKPIWDMEARDGSLARATLRRTRTGEDSTERGSSGARYEQFRAFPGGMIELIETLANKIRRENIHLDCPIESLNQTNEGIAVIPSSSAHDQHVFDHVVLATPATITAKLLVTMQATLHDETQSNCIETIVSNLQSITYASTAIVVMAVPRNRVSRLPRTFGFVVPPSERRSVLAGSFASEKFFGRAPQSHVIIRAFVGGALHPETLDKRDDEIVEIVATELGDMIGLDAATSVTEYAAFVRVVRWNNAMPQYQVGHLEIASAIRSAMQQLSRIELATNAIDGVGIAPVIANAERTAKHILGTYR
jgi:oxygen-dependent protoporphyrinogen oxidase